MLWVVGFESVKHVKTDVRLIVGLLIFNIGKRVCYIEIVYCLEVEDA